MKLKLIAAAAALALSGAAHAAIDTGTDGSGSFFLTMWDGAQSYTTDLSLQMSDFTAGVAAAGSYSFNFNLAADAVFNSFISTANVANLVWNVMAVESQGARTVIESYSELPADRVNNSNGRLLVSGTQAFLLAVNEGMAAQGNPNSAVFSAGSPGYANNPTGVQFGNNHAGVGNFINTGSLANNSYAAGLNLVSMAIAATGTAASIYTPLNDADSALRAYIGPGYSFSITTAPVPEPETYAMLLAGLGLMGAIARRRRKQQG